MEGFAESVWIAPKQPAGAVQHRAAGLLSRQHRHDECGRLDLRPPCAREFPRVRPFPGLTSTL